MPRGMVVAANRLASPRPSSSGVPRSLVMLLHQRTDRPFASMATNRISSVCEDASSVGSPRPRMRAKTAPSTITGPGWNSQPRP